MVVVVKAISVTVAAVASVVVVVAISISFRKRRKQRTNQAEVIKDRCPEPDVVVSSAYEALIGNTPLIKLQHVSRILGRSIYVKMESLNPGGTGKDRAALHMIRQAEASGDLPPPRMPSARNIIKSPSPKEPLQSNTDEDVNGDEIREPTCTPNSSSSSSNTSQQQQQLLLLELIQRARKRSSTGGLVVEGTSGSTGIALATLCAARGHACIVVMPDDQALEKQHLLMTLGALVHVVPTAAIANPHHYVNVARRMATLARRGDHQCHNMAAVFLNQFENPANVQIHYQMTGPELWQQCVALHNNDTNRNHTNSNIMDAFVMSSGTGGTLAGVGRYLKEQQQHAPCRVVLVDPPGSSLYHKVVHGVAYAPQQRERVLKRHRYDTIAEGIGLDRITYNFQWGLPYIDDAIRVTDQEAVDMAHWLLSTEGLWVGSSSAMNVVGAVRVARDLPPDSVVVTMICDGGQRHVTRFWNRAFVEEWGLEWPDENTLPQCIKEFLLSNNEGTTTSNASSSS